MADRLEPDPFHPGAFRVVFGETSQSWVDPDDPLNLAFEYVQRVAAILDETVLARDDDVRLRVVHVGGGGLTLPRYVAARRPHTAQVVLEPDAELTDEVRRKLPLPRHSGIKVRAQDGRAGVGALPEGYADAVVLDAFDGSQVPASLVSGEFFAELALRCRPGAVLVANVTDRAPFGWTRRVAAGVTRAFRHVDLSAEPAVWKGRRFGNLVFAASDAGLPTHALNRRAAQSPFPYRSLGGRDLTRWLGGAQPFTDADAEPSPPAGGRAWFS